MHSGLRFLLLLPLAALLCCGSSPSSTSNTANTANTAPSNFNGDWVAATPYTTNSAYMPFTTLSGPLQVSNGIVTGTLTPSTSDDNSSENSNLCAAVNTPLIVSGTLDGAQDLSLTFPVAGGTGMLLATLADNPTTFAAGSWQVTGGLCPMSETPMWIKGTPTTPITPASSVQIAANLSGNWGLVASPNSITLGITQAVTGFSGALAFSNGNVTGTLNAYLNGNSGNCQQHILGSSTVTGTLDDNNNLTMTFPLATGTVTANATLGPSPQSFANGSFQVAGGYCGTLPITIAPMTIAQYAPLTGTYSGTFNVPNLAYVPAPDTNIKVTAVITQFSTANVIGEFPFTATVNVTGACTDSQTLTGYVSGSGFSSVISGPTFNGSFNPSASAIYSAFYTSTNCPAYYQGILTLQ